MACILGAKNDSVLSEGKSDIIIFDLKSACYMIFSYLQ